MISATVRDIAIIIIALETIVINVLLAVLIWQIWRLVKMFQTEVKPIIKDTQETVGTVRGTATFVSDNVVDPVVKASGKIAGLRRMLQVLGAGLPTMGSGRKGNAPPVTSSTPTSGGATGQ
jgi:hypothetical protein